MAVSMVATTHAEGIQDDPAADTMDGKCLECVLYGNYYCTDTNDVTVDACMTVDDYNNDATSCPIAATVLS
eukprot:CAMPEP_0116881080 /NCGR_PEP_ID=MMETSP0463-20121206/13147_1 /TAXON_ID=181622 /ORGANISM="Strombidinopsis sp, Strain SopsisLIS2011" /LENGTH=70 /DNA_ID=CAMNT_0004532577 /DNA_START=32 /DNA_END=244 /DNA_ORIENTATION=-